MQNGANGLRLWTERLTWLIVVIATVLFLFFNMKAGSVRLHLWPDGEGAEFPVVLVIGTAFILGFLASLPLMLVGLVRRTAEQRHLRRRTEELEREVSRLRNLPLDGDLHALPESDRLSGAAGGKD
jgi:uncharacterized integral membrane protein